MNRAKLVNIGVLVAAVCGSLSPGGASAANLLVNGSFEGPTGQAPDGWKVGGQAFDKYEPVAIAYNQGGQYPYGAQGESVPADDAMSPDPDAAGLNGVYFVSDEAKNLSLSQYVYLKPGTYQIGFDSYDTFNGRMQPHDAVLTADIAGVQLANFALSGGPAGVWLSHQGEAKIQKAGTYLVSFVFNTPETPANPDPQNPGGEYNAKDVVIDRAYVLASSSGGGTVIPSVPLPASLPMFGATLLALAAAGLGLKRRAPAKD